ncbi:hypothetical protein C8R43DRAFT_1126608 [Mycena crocata]|nr:hypothetical protein C8R43DRAFT_1126608 [Mycena crocata]
MNSSPALCASRIALTLWNGTLHRLSFAPTGNPAAKDVRRMEILLHRFCGPDRRLGQICLDFDRNIIERPVGWKMGELALSTICGNSHAAVVVVDTGLFTCPPLTLRRWNPYTRDGYTKVEMHDGSQHLHDVGIWADTITPETATAFLDRHDIFTLKYMPAASIPSLSTSFPPLSLPNLRRLAVRTRYIVHMFPGPASASLFPKLETSSYGQTPPVSRTAPAH